MFPELNEDFMMEAFTCNNSLLNNVMEFFPSPRLYDHEKPRSPLISSSPQINSEWANIKFKLEKLSSTPSPSPAPSPLYMQPSLTPTKSIMMSYQNTNLPPSPVGSSGMVDSPPGQFHQNQHIKIKQERDMNMNLNSGALPQLSPYTFQTPMSGHQQVTSSHYVQSTTSYLHRPCTPESPPPPPRVYKPCFVCQDKSSGYHYGVSACEGCKGFFRRSVQKNMKYTCHRDRNCDINKVTRNRCQYCRFKKCFDVGMSKDCVRNDRNKKKKSVEVSESVTIPTEMEDMISKVFKAHLESFPPKPKNPTFAVKQENESSQTDVEDQTLTDINFSIPQGGLSSPSITLMNDLWNDNPFFSNEQPVAPKTEVDSKMLDCVTDMSTRAIVMVVDFAKKLPGFLSLSTQDQITLLKAACLEILTLRISAKFNHGDGNVTFTSGMTMNEEQLKSGGFEGLLDNIIALSTSLRKLKIDDKEMALLAAICVISGDRSGLEDAKGIEKLQEPLLESLRLYVKKRRPHEHNVFAKILMKITDIRSISVRSAERVMHLKYDKPGEIPALINEMVDRNDEDSDS